MEFTGKENIIMNAVLQGMSKDEIDQKINKIIEYADIGDQINEPLRTYSSGMVVRLAFAIITQLEADILVIDEALAVGDAYFTQKCMRFIHNFKRNGTVLFVSHDTNAVLSLCNKAILIEEGEISIADTAKKVVEEYNRRVQRNTSESNRETKEYKRKENSIKEPGENSIEQYQMRWTDYRAEGLRYSNSNEIRQIERLDIDELRDSLRDEKVEVSKIEVMNMEQNTKAINTIFGGEIINLRISMRIKKSISNLVVGFILKNDKGLTILGDNTLNRTPKTVIDCREGFTVTTEFIFTMPLLSAGGYSITVAAADGSADEHEILVWKNDALLLESRCSNVAAGLAGIPMHSIKISSYR